MYLGFQEGKIKFYTEEPLDVLLYQLDKSEYTESEYVLDGEEYVLNNEAYKQEQKTKEREKINMLALTAADVERAIYKDKGIDFEDILNLVQNNSNIDSKALKIELKANNFYRGNPWISQIGTLLGYSSEDLDYLFINKEFKMEDTNGSNNSDDTMV